MANLPRRHFLPWDRPLLIQAVEFLAAGWQGPAPLDLSRLLVIVPTRQSGRRLREALAEYAAGRQSAVFPPRVLTPEALLVPDPHHGAATRLETLLAWIDVLQAADLGDFRAVIPYDPPARNFSWAMRLAHELQRVALALAENGCRMRDVADRVGSDFSEFERWQQLAELEGRYLQRLQAAGRRDPGAVVRDPAISPNWERGAERVVMLAVADPVPAAITVLEARAASLPIAALIFAPESEAGSFDAWGRPIAAVWSQANIAPPDFERRVQVCADPATQARRMVGVAKRYYQEARDPSAGLCAVGVADPEVLVELEAEANRNQIPAYNPEGHLHRQGALHQLLTALAECVIAPSLDAVTALLRCPDITAYLASRCGKKYSAAATLRSLDDLRQRHLPADLEAARRFAGEHLERTLAVIDELRARIEGQPFPEGIAAALASIFADRRLDPSHVGEARLQAAAGAWTAVLQECAAARALFGQLSVSDGWELALRNFGEIRIADDKPANAIELQGWLELLFEDAPHLIVGGFNDGFVPDAIAGDAFLPESLRVRLGLKTNAQRFARDAYVFRALLASRVHDGRVDLLLGRTSATADPLRPSRLLFRCPDTELPRRIAHLFRAPDLPDAHQPWTRAWQLQVEAGRAPRQIAVTSLRRWLDCPFRFYLRAGLGMESIDVAKSEMDAFDFGTLCHAALEAMGRDRGMRDCTDAEELRRFLVTEVTRLARMRYGDELSLPLSIQLESARQRLAKAAAVQAKERAAGWIVQEVERSFALPVHGVTVNGKIDRIDRNEITGLVRVLDYKTSDTAVTPAAAHLRARRRDEAVPDWRVVLIDGKERVWIDLQLPMYRRALATEFGEQMACGYFNLPKAVGLIGIAQWENYGVELHHSASRCADGVCQALIEQTFWPPNEDLSADADDFARLFHHGVAASVAWAGKDGCAR